MKIRNTLKHIFSLPFAVGFLLASLIFTTMDTYYSKRELERDKLFQEMQDRHHQERLEWQDRHHQEWMKELKRKKG